MFQSNASRLALKLDFYPENIRTLGRDSDQYCGNSLEFYPARLHLTSASNVSYTTYPNANDTTCSNAIYLTLSAQDPLNTETCFFYQARLRQNGRISVCY
jgi:hypothetical protein